MDVAVGVGRAVVQDELRRALPRAPESSRRGPWRPSGRASPARSSAGSAFIGKSVRGRLTVSFHSGMGIRRFYNELMATSRPRQNAPSRLDNGLKVLVQEEHTAPLASVWCWYTVGSKDERPGLTGVSHWVEHMNFKGTTNIPRDQVKGIIEQFGGSWNGYTWIDQTTYLETATRDALDRMLFIESERMASCLYDPDDCESERTVIISELQGGENDPDQLLDQELTATAFKAHPYRHPTIGWLADLQTMTRRRSVRLLPPLLRPQQRHARRSSATWTPTRRIRRASSISARFRGGASASRRYTVEPEQTGERRLTIRKRGDDGLPEGRLPRAGSRRSRVLPAAGARCGVDRREGGEPVVQLPRAAAAAQRAAVPRAGRARPAVVGLGGAAADASSRFSTRSRSRRPTARRSASVEGVLLEELERGAARGITDGRTRARRRRSSGRGWCSRATASRTSPISWDTSRRSPASTSCRRCRARIAAVTLDEVAAVSRRGCLTDANRTVGWFEPVSDA